MSRRGDERSYTAYDEPFYEPDVSSFEYEPVMARPAINDIVISETIRPAETRLLPGRSVIERSALSASADRRTQQRASARKADLLDDRPTRLSSLGASPRATSRSVLVSRDPRRASSLTLKTVETKRPTKTKNKQKLASSGVSHDLNHSKTSRVTKTQVNCKERPDPSKYEDKTKHSGKGSTLDKPYVPWCDEMPVNFYQNKRRKK